jgi:hypothetical protein
MGGEKKGRRLGRHGTLKHATGEMTARNRGAMERRSERKSCQTTPLVYHSIAHRIDGRVRNLGDVGHLELVIDAGEDAPHGGLGGFGENQASR